uniref:hypothetical protein n=1 Tax=Limnohabitans sp. TaxID=1907725 RepID=UPI0040471ECD
RFTHLVLLELIFNHQLSSTFFGGKVKLVKIRGFLFYGMVVFFDALLVVTLAAEPDRKTL